MARTGLTETAEGSRELTMKTKKNAPLLSPENSPPRIECLKITAEKKKTPRHKKRVSQQRLKKSLQTGKARAGGERPSGESQFRAAIRTHHLGGDREK